MKKIIVALVLVAGVSTLVYQSTQNAKLSRADHDQARVLLADYFTGGDRTGSEYSSGLSSPNDTSAKPAKPGCRNSLACNYDKTATTDGGVCEYAFWSRGMDLQGKLLFDGLDEEVFDPLRKELGQDPLPYEARWSPELENKYNEFLLDRNADEGELQKILNDKSVLKYRCAANAHCEALSITSWTMPASFLVSDGVSHVANDTRRINLVGYASEKTVAALNGTKACESPQYKKIKKDAEQEVKQEAPKAKVNPKQKPAGSKNKR